MSNETKKYAGLEALQTFLDGCKTLFATITHKHKLEDITDYVVDSELNSESMNPIQNSTVKAELDYIKDAKADWNQNNENAIDYIKNRTHGEVITEGEVVIFDNNELDFKFDGMHKNNSSSEEIQVATEKLIVGQSYTVVLDGTTYENLVCYEDISNIYGTNLVIGAPFSGVLNGATNWVDYPFGIKLQDNIIFIYMYDTSRKDSVHSVKVTTVDKTITVKQLDEKFIPDTIARTDYVHENFALKSDIKDVDLSNYYTKEEIDNLELITVDDIDTICGASIQIASAKGVVF